ncbi:MCE family protein [candidate division KSB1 bacterium]|nr:MCE family protein [candidate division KSB1 bacterium]NIR71157.1 MCE family protein [candidate division KSB1 bacterium]NIS23287.1 MCE family protein [candidate division KSB1 bacterium]NIT70166.1 MCE family protein [candidate division KSB1 bacterium]NIU23817.1 MCE family protein [candidate division KSB1 bacterium]
MRKIGAEIVSGIAIFLAFIIFIFGFLFLKNTALKSGSYSLFVQFDDVTGLEPNDVVNVSGLKVGQVENFEFKNLVVWVELLIDEEIRLPKDSKIQIKSLGMIGEKFVDIVPGSSSEMFQAEERVEGSSTGGFSELSSSMEGLVDQTQQVLSRLLNVFDTVLDEAAQKSLKESFIHFNKVSSSLDKNTVHFERTLANLENISTNLDEILAERRDQVENSIDNLHAASNRLDGLTTKMESSLASMQTLLSKIENQEGAVGKVILRDELYNDIRSLTTELDGLVKDLKKRPQKYLNLGFIKVF